jgi:hypothetical protein
MRLSGALIHIRANSISTKSSLLFAMIWEDDNAVCLILRSAEGIECNNMQR